MEFDQLMERIEADCDRYGEAELLILPPKGRFFNGEPGYRLGAAGLTVTEEIFFKEVEVFTSRIRAGITKAILEEGFDELESNEERFLTAQETLAELIECGARIKVV